jgi:hypothetical protein
MPRVLRIDYPGCICHVMKRSDRREPIFEEDADQMGIWTKVSNHLANKSK